MQRRQALATAMLGTAGAAAATAVGAQETVNWNMVMPWPKQTPGLGLNAQRFAAMVEAMSAGRIKIRVFGGGELVPPFECLDAVQSGTADLSHGTPYYWAGKAPALHFFTTTPFGLMADELTGWLYKGGGMELWREVYAPFGVVPFYAGNSRLQAGGWFKREINSLADLEGLKFRIAGLGGEVMRQLGVNTVLLPPGEIGPALLSGAIDAAEWVGPWNDRAFGLYKSASHYYAPAFHEPGAGLEIIVNQESFDALSPDLQAIVEAAASAIALETTADFAYNNAVSLGPLLAENDVELHTWPDEVVLELGRTTKIVMQELAAGDPMSAKVFESYEAFRKEASAYAEVFERRFLEMRAMAENA